MLFEYLLPRRVTDESIGRRIPKSGVELLDFRDMVGFDREV